MMAIMQMDKIILLGIHKMLKMDVTTELVMVIIDGNLATEVDGMATMGGT